MRTRVIVVLNDNGMSIAPNVGAVSRMLEALRTATPYRGAKQIARQVIDHMPGSDLAEETRRRLFTSLKALLIPNLLFEQLGFTYLGPVDGHDLFAVESVLEKARDFGDGPVFVHLHTQKGQGYGPAEDDNVKWHGVSATGAAKPAGPQYTAVFADTVREILKADPRAVAITAAMPGGTGMQALFNEFPTRRPAAVGAGPGAGAAPARASRWTRRSPRCRSASPRPCARERTSRSSPTGIP